MLQRIQKYQQEMMKRKVREITLHAASYHVDLRYIGEY